MHGCDGAGRPGRTASGTGLRAPRVAAGGAGPRTGPEPRTSAWGRSDRRPRRPGAVGRSRARVGETRCSGPDQGLLSRPCPRPTGPADRAGGEPRDHQPTWRSVPSSGGLPPGGPPPGTPGGPGPSVASGARAPSRAGPVPDGVTPASRLSTGTTDDDRADDADQTDGTGSAGSAGFTASGASKVSRSLRFTPPSTLRYASVCDLRHPRPDAQRLDGSDPPTAARRHSAHRRKTVGPRAPHW